MFNVKSSVSCLAASGCGCGGARLRSHARCAYAACSWHLARSVHIPMDFHGDAIALVTADTTELSALQQYQGVCKRRSCRQSHPRPARRRTTAFRSRCAPAPASWPVPLHRVFLQLVDACNSFLDVDTNLCANTPGQATLPLLSCQDVALDLGRRARQPADAADVGRVTLDRHLATQILQCAKEYVSWPQPTHNLHVERRLKLASSIDANLASHVDD